MNLDIFNLEQKGILANDIFQEQNMSDMEKEETVKKPPTIAISPSFLYGVTAGVKVREPRFVSPKSILPRVESTSARSRRCFTRQDVASPGLKSTTRAMAANKTWFEIVLFKYSQS